MHRVSSAANGFEKTIVRGAKARYLSVELTSGHAIYGVGDPGTPRRRINLWSSRPMVILVIARRIADFEHLE
jgi:hypothetical protein